MSSWLKFIGGFVLLLIVISTVYFFARPVAYVPTISDRLYFSQLSERTPAVANYPQGATIISSINDYPALWRLFDRSEIAGWLTPDLLRFEANSLLSRQAEVDDFSRSYIYQTSYYLGNLLVTPNQYLVEVLEDKPVTAFLIEYALADVRAMATQLQDVFDVPPPRFYETGLEAGLFYTHPSFPSLLGAEAYIIYLLLAEIDPKNARHYAIQAGEYVAALRASATHYDFDIDYSLELSARLLPIIANHPGYQGFFTAGREEWVDYRPASVITNLPTEILPGFNLARRVSATARSEGSGSNLEGSLILALVDSRLPEASRRLYEVSVFDTKIVPFALDLTPRQQTGLLPSLGDYVPVLDRGYYFSSADFRLINRLDKRGVYPRQVWTRANLDAAPRLLLNTNVTEPLKNLRLNRSGSYAIAWSNDGQLSVIDIATNQVLDLGLAQSAVWGGNEEVWFVTGLGVESFVLASRERNLLGLTDLNLDSDSIKLVSDDVGESLVLIKQLFNQDQLQFEADIMAYKRSGAEWRLVAQSRMNDVKIYSSVLSPDTNHLAILASDGITNHSGSILLFDIRDGIIKKDISLTDFSPANRSLEAWVF